jgi:hypothetical protein
MTPGFTRASFPPLTPAFRGRAYSHASDDDRHLWMRLFQATSVSVDSVGWVGVMSVGRSSSLPLWNTAPARTRATRCGALTARQRLRGVDQSVGHGNPRRARSGPFGHLGPQPRCGEGRLDVDVGSARAPLPRSRRRGGQGHGRQLRLGMPCHACHLVPQHRDAPRRPPESAVLKTSLWGKVLAAAKCPSSVCPG